MGQTPPSTTGAYIYCVARAQSFEKGSLPFATPGIGGRDKAVRIIQRGDLAELIRLSVRRELGQNSADEYAAQEAALLAQLNTLRAELRGDTEDVGGS
jgi:hypothetical protein